MAVASREGELCIRGKNPLYSSFDASVTFFPRHHLVFPQEDCPTFSVTAISDAPFLFTFFLLDIGDPTTVSPTCTSTMADIYDADKWIEQLRTCQHLAESDMKKLCDRVRNLLLEESNIQPVSSPVTICGDIHGQFWDLLELLRKGGEVPQTSYIFMARMLSPCPWI